MQIFDVVMIGLALSMDACAITIANCATYKCALNKKNIWTMPTFFALFQGIMPLIGFFIGYLFAGFIGQIADFLTAGIFFILCGKIVYDLIQDIVKEKIILSKNECPVVTKFPLGVLIVQALATSIDALAVGVTLINLNFSVYFAVLIIASVTFLLVWGALLFGKTLGKVLGKYAEWFGAVILFALAVKALIQALI